MSLLRVHNFSISLDGFGTGEGQTRDVHFGHARERLHECVEHVSIHPRTSAASRTKAPGDPNEAQRFRVRRA